METLYIIGNGFDKHHGMQTSYYDFAEYLKSNDSHLLDLLESHIDPMSDDDLWARFEENLAKMDVESILSAHSDRLPDYVSDEFRSRDRYVFPDIMEDTLENLTDGLVNRFKDFILNVKTLESAQEKRLRLKKNALFFTFNYTATLENLYQIDSQYIFHIHNHAYSKHNNIILGHGIDPENLKDADKIPPKGLSFKEEAEWFQRLDDDYEYSYDTGKETIYRYFKRSYKPTKEIIEEHSHYFTSLSKIISVYILGHSLSDVDLPYIQKIKVSVSINTIWHVSYYGAKEKASHNKTMLNLGIKKENIKMVTLNKLQIANKQLALKL